MVVLTVTRGTTGGRDGRPWWVQMTRGGWWRYLRAATAFHACAPRGGRRSSRSAIAILAPRHVGVSCGDGRVVTRDEERGGNRAENVVTRRTRRRVACDAAADAAPCASANGVVLHVLLYTAPAGCAPSCLPSLGRLQPHLSSTLLPLYAGRKRCRTFEQSAETLRYGAAGQAFLLLPGRLAFAAPIPTISYHGAPSVTAFVG